MSGVMSDADFLGASPSGTAPSKTMSDEEFFGTPHQPTPFERLKTGAEELAKKAVPMVQKGARQLVSNAATVLDIPASIGGQMAGIAGGAYGDIKSALDGGTTEQHLAAGQAVKEATSAAVPQGGFKMMLQQALGEHLGKNAVEDVMGKIGGVIDQAGALVDKAVGVKGIGGQISDPMTLYGMKFTKDAVTGKVTPAPKWQGMDKITPEVPHDLPTMTPEDIVKAQTVGPQATAAEHINQLNGILDPKEQRARSKQASADAKVVFADKQNWVKDPETGEQVFQPQYTSYLEGQMYESVTNAEYLKAERLRQEAAQRETAAKHQEAWEKSGGQAARVWPEEMTPENKMRQMEDDLHAREAAEQNPHTPGQAGDGIGGKDVSTLSSRNRGIIKAGLGAGAVAAYLAASPEEQKEMAEGAGILGAVLATRSHGDGAKLKPHTGEIKEAFTGPTKVKPRQEGKTDTQQLAAVAGGVAGALYGATQDKDNLLEGAALYGIAGAVGGSLTARFGPAATTAFGDATRLALGGKPWEAAKGLLPGPISAAFAEDSRVRIKPQMDAWETAEKRDALARSHMVLDTVNAVPDKARREAISHALEGQAVPLTPVERGVAQKIQSYLAGLGARGMDAGVIKDLVSDYVTHIYGKDAVPVIQDWLKTRTLGATTSVYGKTRVGPPTLAEVNKLMRDKGLPPIETDIASIMEQYGKSMSRAIAGKTLVDTLKARTVPRDYKGKTIETPLIMADVPGKTPGDYKGFGKQGLVAHPDIIPALKFAFENTNPLVHIRALEAVNTAVKRSAISFSLFHAKSLLDGFVAATQMNGKQMAIGGVAGALYGLANNDDPITYALAAAGLAGYGPGLVHVAQAAVPKVFGMNKYVAALRDSKLAQTDPAMAKMIDMAIQGGLEFTLPGGEGAVKDVNKGFYEGAKWLQNAADAVIPGGGKAVEGITKLNHAVDGFMWERLHTGMKLEVFAKTYEKLTINNAKAHAESPKGVPLLDETAIAERAGSFTNDIFGGINWRRIAEECKTRFGRDLAQSVYSPQGQRGLRLVMFAPDWTIATTRAAMKMGGQLVGQEAGTNLKGFFKPSTVTDFHRQYVLRAALNYVMIGDGINYAFTGRHLWQEKGPNKDPTYINLGDGRKMQFNKHAMEPVHWLLHPGQQALGKLSQPIREGLNQALGTEYLAPHLDKRTGNVVAGPMMRESAGKHLLNTISPIGVSQATGGGAQAGLMSMLGIPIYGMTAEQKAQVKLEQKKRLVEMGK